jgi:hypothetical protein
MIYARGLTATLILAASLGLAGCATTSGPSASSSGKVDNKAAEIVKKRAVERWEFLINRQSEKAYDYLSPGYRATKKREDYASEMNNRPVQWTKVYPSSETCDKPDICSIRLAVEYQAQMPGVGKSVPSVGFVTETWIKSKGKWWHLPSSVK